MSTDQPREGLGQDGRDEAQESATGQVPRVEHPTAAMPQAASHGGEPESGWNGYESASGYGQPASGYEGFSGHDPYGQGGAYGQGTAYGQEQGYGTSQAYGPGQSFGQGASPDSPYGQPDSYPAGSQYGPAHSGPGMPGAPGGPGGPAGPGGYGGQGYGPQGPRGARGTGQQGERKRLFGLPALAATALIASLIGGGVAGGIAASKHSGESSSSAGQQQGGGKITIENGQKASAASAVAAKASPSVVTVGAIRGQDGGSGSGIVMDKEGHIMTNAHVVTVNGHTDNVNLQVRLWDNRVYNAKLVGADPLADIAVIKVDGAPNLTPATFGDSGSINVGDMAVVIGSPLGLSGTVTDGIISTKSRTIGLTNSQSTSEDSSNPNDKVYVNVIQTDAALNHGNSGGALVDGKGEVIGVNVAILSGSQSSSGSDSGNSGLGFAIPINAAKRVAESLMKDGKASHGFLGVQVKSQPPSGVSGESIFSTGAVINQIESGSPAEKAGLRKGDVITSVDSMVVEDAKSLTAAVRTFASGQQAKFKVNRDGKEQEITVTLGSIPNS
ncbi:S1C family serine protease [Arthrobacter sp. UM1]|uniref:S1C family serine protease n=1 Tax=Arthrobacter sp. UM1 TaxID=2766776 RepID=UPI001CF64CD3|nr:trypsin-like peptidase domain-containing protein [Arthrobacter sp. UM1]MCB4207789.1 trypsin-like peptidase domain-containing protein [Arthrobacter sp. UM1]